MSYKTIKARHDRDVDEFGTDYDMAAQSIKDRGELLDMLGRVAKELDRLVMPSVWLNDRYEIVALEIVDLIRKAIKDKP